MRKFPWCTTLLILTTTACGIYFFQDFRSPVYYGFIPREFDRNGGLTFLSSFLLHGGWIHLLSNMYFLFVFGRTVEDKIGWIAFLALVVFATAGGNFLTICFDPQSDIPHVGASGGIAGVLLFYGFTFSRKRLVFFMGGTYGLMLPRLIRIPAWAALLLWVLIQLFGASFQTVGISSVSYSSHLGGLLVGLLFWFLWRRIQPSAKPKG
jgi:membrane associated rhomboid family serine protease